MQNFKKSSGLVKKIKSDVNDRLTKEVNIESDNKIKGEESVENYITANDELFINVSHELNTPLNVIYSATQLIELYLQSNDINKPDKILYGVNSIKQNSFRLMKLINNILDLSKIEAGLYKLSLSYINIVELVENVVHSVSDTIKEERINFIFDTDVEEKFIKVDIQNIQRVLLNILSNAVKFSKNKGKVLVKITSKENYVNIAITDLGIGIEKGHFDNIFNRFGQVDKSLSRTAEGSGIGLKLSRAIIEAHGGSINVLSEINKGSTFIIKLPVNKDDLNNSINYNRVVNYDNLSEMIKIEFSDIDYLGA